jgi:hypothetical protein
MPQELLRQLQHLGRHRRREQQRLTRRRQDRQDALDVGPEAHIQHPVGFVQHEDFKAPEPDRLVPHVVHQPAWRGDDDVHPGLEGAFLNVHRHAAEDRHARHRRVVGQTLHLIFDLDGQLTGRRENQRPRRGLSDRALPQELLEDRDEKRGRLSGARLRTCDDIVAGHCERNHAALHRPRLGPSQVADAAQQPRVELKGVERERRRIEVSARTRGAVGSVDVTPGP